MDSPFVRRSTSFGYPLHPSAPGTALGVTLQMFQSSDPVLLKHRGQFQSTRGQLVRGGSVEDAAHQQAWLNHNLATTCRNILGVSLSRPGSDDDRFRHNFRDGVLKVENRLPHHISVFRTGHESELFLPGMWSCVAIRPYLRYLAKNPQHHSTNINDVGWLRRYNDLSTDVPLFQQLRKWYGSESDESQRVVMAEQAARLKEPLGHLLSFVDTAETYLQHAAAAIRYALIDSEIDQCADYALIQNAHSFFNLINIFNIWKYAEQVGLDKSDSQTERNRIRTWVRGQRLCLRQELPAWINLSLPPEGLQGVDMEGLIATAMNHRVSGLTGRLDWPTDGISREELLNGQISELDFFEAVRWALMGLNNLAKSLQSFVDRPLADVPEAVRPLIDAEYQRMQLCIDRVVNKTVNHSKQLRLRVDYQKEKRTIASSRSIEVEKARELMNSYVREAMTDFADAVSAAAMDSHTFGDADKARLLFVSRRVDQLLDNRIIAIAQSRNIFLSFDDAAILQIDEFTVDCLARIRTNIEAVDHSLKRILSVTGHFKTDHLWALQN